MTSAWFRGYRPVAQPRARLVCFAHAGGGPSAFRSWHDGLPADVEVLGVRYPGRQDRLAEDCVAEMHPLADAIASAITPLLDKPLVFFGHSMGAWVAYEVALRLRRDHGFSLDQLLVSGQVPPHRREPGGDDPGTDAVIAEVQRLGGYDAQLFEDPELRELVLPAILADFSLVRTYAGDPLAVVDAPVVAYFGEQDEDARPEEVRAWAERTTAGYAQRSFPGGHFYLAEHEAELLREISARLAPAHA
ncbi:alpha/beta fold hydrolase [Allokutzneria sp. A3M-2-11 16]|uniref:thioesterase II family protein n=1 Tax=Allokutzneria sp. A3M-2-11 16 TaxID=2962043 RepID=UPI0020B68E5B|nr:alpha/beta fold hydrolase [Allokutzneria sp. A3M-2-11 16]MCP3804551.1 alpha/beta fold hydrolase [Allokutzneria sp. A3M-2-11 16]